MYILDASASFRRATVAPFDPTLKRLLSNRIGQLKREDEQDSERFVVFGLGDTLPALDTELGFSVLNNLVDNVRFGEPDFEPSWEWIKDHGGWFELVFLLTDDGFAHVVFVEDRDGVEPELLALCRQYT